VYVNTVTFIQDISRTLEDPPTGFLFLSSRNDFYGGQSSFKRPDCPVYWSFNPSGTEHLSMDEAIRLGFPPIQFTTEVGLRWWDESTPDSVSSTKERVSIRTARMLSYLWGNRCANWPVGWMFHLRMVNHCDVSEERDRTNEYR
jgi:hypothetical protein